MKKLLLLVLLSPLYVFAQNDSISEQTSSEKYSDRQVRFMSDVRVSFIRPNAVGDNFLAKGNEGEFGLGLRFGVFKAYNFSLGVGGEVLFYNTTDAAFGGAINSINMNSGYIEVMYKIPVAAFQINPKASIGYTSIYYNTDGDRGEQDGLRLAVGAFADYNINRWFAVFLGADYIFTYPKVETNAAYRDFFGKVQQFNFSAGVKFTIRD